MGSALKKTAHAAEQERPDVAARRLAWLESQPDLDPRRLVFIDETGASTKMARLRGRSKRGQRCRAAVPHGHWKTARHVELHANHVIFRGALKTELADDAPLLRADKLKLKQILINLLSNAIKFTDAGGKVTLKAWCSVNGGYVFQVIDTGIGIALEDIPKALLPFQQIDNRLNRKFEGTGLGLPLSKTLVEMHGGSLDLQSQVGVGTTVTVRFPAERIVPLRHDNNALGTADRKAS